MTTRSVDQLRPHPKNQEIYGDHSEADLSADFIESVKDKGVLVSLLITKDDRIISGHRRWSGAKAAGLDKVPVVVFPSDDEDEILEALIHANKQREKSNEQIAREAALLFEVEGRLAEARRLANLKTQGDKKDKEEGNSSPDGALVRHRGKMQENGKVLENGRTDKKVGERLGIGAAQAVKAKAVIEKIESLQKQGKEEQAEKIRETLNKKSIGAAYKEATKPEPLPSDDEDEESEEAAELFDQAEQLVPPQAFDAFNQLPNLRQLLSQMDRLAKEIETIGKTPVGKKTHWQSAQSQVRAARKTLNAGRPAYVCPYCRGKKTDCTACYGDGWVTAATYEQAPPEMKEIQRNGKGGAK